MRFTQLNSMKSHRSSVHSETETTTTKQPTLQCELCPVTCKRPTDLRNHVLHQHTSVEPVPCRKCGKDFPDRYSLKVHHRDTHVNVGEIRYRCDGCDFSSGRNDVLERHKVLTHSTAMPYTCGQCERRFKLKSQVTGQPMD